MGAKISIYLDTRVKKADTVYPLKLRVTFERERSYIGIPKERINTVLNNSILEKYRYEGLGNYSIKEDLFKSIMSAKKGGILKDLQTIFKGIELDAQKKADKLEPFTFVGFKALLSTQRSKENRTFALFQEIIDGLNGQDRVGTAISYGCAATSLKKFVGARDVPLEYFTKERLEKYRKWMLADGCSDTTVGMYLRALRVVFNEAIEREITVFYPFARRSKEEKDKFKIPKGKGRKIALNKEDLTILFNYQLPEKHPYNIHLDMWKLMFMLGGINPIDLFTLRESNIKDGFVFYTRHKTIRTSHEKKIIQVPYTGEVAEIIEKWKVPQEKDSYLLPGLDSKMTAKEKKARVSVLVKLINDSLNNIAESIGMSKHITTYVARHSIATQLLQSGASVRFIGDQLGHHNTATTEAYLEGFADDQIREAYNKALKF